MIHPIRREINDMCADNIKNIDNANKNHLKRIDTLEALLIMLMKPFPKSGMRSPIGYIVRMDVERKIEAMKYRKKLSTIQRIMRWFK